MQKAICCTVALFVAISTQSLAQQSNDQTTVSDGENSAFSKSIMAGPGKVNKEQAMSGKSHGKDMPASDMSANHEHPSRPANPDLPVPGLSHLVFPDAMDGYNVQILSRYFSFTPAAINREVVANEGHAHIYINGVKIARIYSNWYHLPSSLFSPGLNAVTVTLNANDHSTWATPDGEMIASTVPVIRPDLAR